MKVILAIELARAKTMAKVMALTILKELKGLKG
jgi:hypothetical protein